MSLVKRSVFEAVSGAIAIPLTKLKNFTNAALVSFCSKALLKAIYLMTEEIFDSLKSVFNASVPLSFVISGAPMLY